MMANSEAVLATAKRFIEFVNKSPSPYHVVNECRKRLATAGFTELSEKLQWQIEPNGKYFLTRNKSTIIAFAVGGAYQPGNGFSLIGAHTDSPCLKVKPISKKSGNGFLSVGVECYGGGIWASWFDRDLTVAGRAIVKADGKLNHRLIHIERPILRVPHICIHLQRDVNDKFGPNKETQVVPVLATSVMNQLNSSANKTESNLKENKDEDSSKVKSQRDKHHSVLFDLLCENLKCKPEDLMDFELHLADTQPAAIGGILNEFIFSPRLDNLVNAYTALQGLVDAESLATDTNIRLIVLYDNEEVGSLSAQGAQSKLLDMVMKRILIALKGTDEYERSIANSFLISADQAHAVHPNYADKHESNHKPAFHGGPVLKFNSNQRYATTAVTASILRSVAEKCGVPLQDVVVRNDSACGSTIGPISAAKLGVRTVDIGGPTLSMHSIREMCCTSQIQQTITLYKTFFEELPKIDASLIME